MRKKRNKKVAKTSNLLYPITVLEAERDNIHGLPGSQVAQLNKAIDILNDEKKKDEIKERKKDKRIGKKNFYDL